MHFELNEEQQALQDSLSRLLADLHGPEDRRRIASSTAGWSESLWQAMVELGLCAMPVAEQHGGLNGTAVDNALVMQALGRAAVASPWLCSVAVPAAALSVLDEGQEDLASLGAQPTLTAQWLQALATGDKRLAWAHDEPSGDGSDLWIGSRAHFDKGQWRLHGAKSAVHHGAGADAYLVTARTAGREGEEEGRGLFVVDAHNTGLTPRAHRLIDGTPAVELQMDGVRAQALAADGARARWAMDAAFAVGIAGLVAEATGAMEAAQALTVDYLKTRQQFGRPIGQNQALRHTLAEMQVSLELVRSMSVAAAMQAQQVLLGTDDAQTWSDLHGARLVLARHGRGLAEAAIQLHGGIGMTQEYPVGQVLLRLLVLETLFGETDWHARRLDELTFPTPA